MTKEGDKSMNTKELDIVKDMVSYLISGDCFDKEKRRQLFLGERNFWIAIAKHS